MSGEGVRDTTFMARAVNSQSGDIRHRPFVVSEEPTRALEREAALAAVAKASEKRVPFVSPVAARQVGHLARRTVLSQGSAGYEFREDVYND